MSVELYSALWGLLFASIGGLTLLLRLVGLRLQAAVDEALKAAQAAESNSNGKLSALLDENVRLKLEIEQLRAIIHSGKE